MTGKVSLSQGYGTAVGDQEGVARLSSPGVGRGWSGGFADDELGWEQDLPFGDRGGLEQHQADDAPPVGHGLVNRREAAVRGFWYVVEADD